MNTIVKQFMCCLDLKSVSFDCIKNLTWDEQAKCIEMTIKHPLIVSNPIKYGYQVAFLKKIIDIWETESDEVHDDVYETYCDLKSKSDGDFSFKHYGPFGDDNRYISLRENSNLISQGTTGLHSWEASLVLSEWCIINKEMLYRKNLLELGSGAGLAGLVVAKCCKPNQIWLTDCHSDVLRLLTHNVSLNFFNSTQPNDKTNNSRATPDERIQFRNNIQENVEIGVLNLPWEDIKNKGEFLQHIVTPDVILASDVVYDSSIFNDLCGAFEYFLKNKRECVIILVCTIRNENTLEQFVKLLESRNHQIDALDQPKPHLLCWPPSVNTRMFKISNRL